MLLRNIGTLRAQLPNMNIDPAVDVTGLLDAIENAINNMPHRDQLNIRLGNEVIIN